MLPTFPRRPSSTPSGPRCRPADQDARGDEPCRAGGRRGRDRAGPAVAELRPGVADATWPRCSWTPWPPRRGDHAGHPAGGVDQPGPPAGGPRRRLGARATWWRSTPGWWPAGTPPSSGGPGRRTRRPSPAARAACWRADDLWDRLLAACRPGDPAATCSPPTRRPGAPAHAGRLRPRPGLRRAGGHRRLPQTARTSTSSRGWCWPSVAGVDGGTGRLPQGGRADHRRRARRCSRPPPSQADPTTRGGSMTDTTNPPPKRSSSTRRIRRPRSPPSPSTGPST